jgi:hypothetical protein
MNGNVWVSCLYVRLVYVNVLFSSIVSTCFKHVSVRIIRGKACMTHVYAVETGEGVCVS